MKCDRVVVAIALVASGCLGSTGTDSSASTGGPAVPGVSATSIDFGTTGCGQTAQSQTLSVTNTGHSSYSFSAALAGGDDSPYTLSPNSGSVEAGASVALTITAKPLPDAVILPALFN